MTTLADNMRAIRPWQILVLVVAPFIVAGMVYGAYTVATRDADDDLAEDQQLIPVQRGDLVNDVSISGSLAYSEREIPDVRQPGHAGPDRGRRGGRPSRRTKSSRPSTPPRLGR